MPAELRFGTAGWSYDDWKGIVYPRRLSTDFDPLSQLATWFDILEVNVTFYRPVELATIENWIRRVAHAPRFGFSIKAPKELTHTEHLDPAVLDSFRRSLQPLVESNRLVAVLFQFPWSFQTSTANCDRLGTLLQEFDQLPCVVEFRHASWDSAETKQRLHAARATLCAIDLPEARDSFLRGPHVTAPLAYLRLHGRNAASWFDRDAGRDARYDYRYNPEEYKSIGEQIRRMQEAAEEVCVIGNNHFRGQAVVSALILQESLTGFKTEVPATLLDLYPELGPHVTAASSANQQQRLF